VYAELPFEKQQQLGEFQRIEDTVDEQICIAIISKGGLKEAWETQVTMAALLRDVSTYIPLLSIRSAFLFVCVFTSRQRDNGDCVCNSLSRTDAGAARV
jgi:hypothetical protein